MRCAATRAVIWRIVSQTQKDAGADVAVRVRRAVVVHIEKPVVGVLVVVATNIEARVRRVEVPVIARTPAQNIGTARGVPG